jgi:hypothetical protein
MAFNFLLCALLFTLPAIVIQKKKLIRENDPHQQIIFPSTTSPILSHINFIEPESDLKVISIDIKKNNLSKISFW